MSDVNSIFVAFESESIELKEIEEELAGGDGVGVLAEGKRLDFHNLAESCRSFGVLLFRVHLLCSWL